MRVSPDISRSVSHKWLRIAAIVIFFGAQMFAAVHAASDSHDADHESGLCAVCCYALHSAKTDAAPAEPIILAPVFTDFAHKIPAIAAPAPLTISPQSARGPPQR